MPSDISGTEILEEDQTTGHRVTKFVQGPVFCNLIMADEINRTPPKTQAALLEVMQERQVTIEGESHAISAPFMVLATQNPLEQEGTYPLPEAQLDRFLVKVMIEYPSAEEELQMLKLTTIDRVADGLDVGAVNTLIKPETAVALQQLCAQITVDEAVAAYAVRLVRTTRDWPGIAIGAGPRGSIALIRIARALALLANRPFVTPDDVKSAAMPVLRHRVTLSPESELEGLSVDEILRAVLEQVAAPRA
jgi:MoxR-like ATPase